MHDVRNFLGHANITTTSRYVQSTPLRLERVLNQMEGSDDVGIGAGDGDRTRDIKLGKLAFYR